MLRLIEADTFPNTVAPPEIILPSFNSRSRLVLGRGSPSCPVDVTISATRDSKEVISRSHAEILINKAGRHVIRDLGSLNGVFVNSIRVSETLLKQNDIVQFGGVAKIAVGEKIHASDVSIRYTYISALKRAGVSSDSSTSSKRSRISDVDNTNSSASTKDDVKINEIVTPIAKSLNEQSEHVTPSNGTPNEIFTSVASSSVADSSRRDQSVSNDPSSFESSALTYMQANSKVLQTENTALKQLQVAQTSTIMELSRGLDELRREYDRLVQELQSVQRQSRDERVRLTTEINMKNDLLEKASIQLSQRSNRLSDVDVATIAATTTFINANIANQLNISDTCRIDISALRSQLSCSLCSDVLVNAVVLPCSHGFCRKCIEVHWTRQHSRCPLCYDPYPHHNPNQLFYFRSTHLEDILWLITEALPIEAQAIVRHRESEDHAALNILGIHEETHLFSPELMRLIGSDTNVFGQCGNEDTRSNLLDDPHDSDKQQEIRSNKSNVSSNSSNNNSSNNNNSSSKLKCKYCLEYGHSEENCRFQNENIIDDGADTDDSLDV